MLNTIKYFLKYTHNKTKRHGYRIIFENSRFVSYMPNCPLTGYFSSDDRTIHVAQYHPNWLSVLAHEYCHFEQQMDINRKANKDYVYEIIDNWMEKRIELSKQKIQQYVRKIRDDELDCEKRAVALIQKFKLPINTIHYIQKANLYLFFHIILERHRVLLPSSLNPLWKKMPNHFNNNYDRIPRGLAEDFKKLLKS